MSQQIPIHPTAPSASALPPYAKDYKSKSPSADDLTGTIYDRYYAPSSTVAYNAATGSNLPGMPPSSFSRRPAVDVSYATFEPMFLISEGKTLDKGFGTAPPVSQDGFHPFITHDVNQVDWLSFLNEARTAATLTEKEEKRSYLPIISIIPGVKSLSAYGVRQYMKGNKNGVVGDVTHLLDEYSTSSNLARWS